MAEIGVCIVSDRPGYGGGGGAGAIQMGRLHDQPACQNKGQGPPERLWFLFPFETTSKRVASKNTQVCVKIGGQRFAFFCCFPLKRGTLNQGPHPQLSLKVLVSGFVCCEGTPVHISYVGFN